MFKSRIQLGLQILQEIREATESDQNITVAQIAENADKSCSFVEQIVSILKDEGFVHGRRGPGGGYSLAKDADGDYPYLTTTISDFSEIFYPDEPEAMFISDDFYSTKLCDLLV